MKKITAFLVALGAAFILSACGGEETKKGTSETENNKSEKDRSEQGELEKFEGTVEHVHGLGYTDVDGVTFASHEGLKIYREGQWWETPYHKNDYMGFNAVKGGMYVSGHPGETSDLPNPVGLQKGRAGEEGLDHLGFRGESDFHLLGVGYENEAVYLLNDRPDEELETGFYRSFDKGETFEPFRAENLPEDLFQLAVHPIREKVVAAAAKTGVFLSEDAGETFKRISEKGQASGLTFTENSLYFGLLQNGAAFKKYGLGSEEMETVPLPEFGEDAVLYSALSPGEDVIIIYTMNGSSYSTEDEGETWKQFLEEGTVTR
ncbi:F510_1955 family glycosylhydrolase [Salimicrobium humidisoli]|uniref:Beta-barrel assembly machine subunit BamC n=1 Tax=Salimicrobium humidisoli TaxID=2029857 RepID=A0ABX4HSI1_9BACI|nr:hypothetical protein [Salimicrobium humidisoli]PBB06173.1 hypothetical protein CKW00_05305 [Salimicrobium humidisoli]